jgi:gas vesicle protein
MSTNTKIVIALLAGVAVGATLGILFAPESGSETREKLNNALKDLGDSIKDLADSGLEDLNETVGGMTNS